MTIENIYRNRTMNEITEGDVGKTLKVAGWVENIRDHGGVSFIDLRDMYGVLQVVMRDTSLLDGITKEDCVSIEGIVEHRDEETYNPKIPTGTIELEAKTVEILGKVYKQIPFEIQTSKETREDAFNGFTVVSSTGAKSYLFPTLFVTIACGAVSGFHSLVSSGTSSKTKRYAFRRLRRNDP